MWSDFKFNDSYAGTMPCKINDIELPNEYIQFMKQHNGGEGNTEGSWLILFNIEELQDVNNDYEVTEYLPNTIIIGSNGSGELFGIMQNGKYFIVPDIICEEDMTIIGDDIANLPLYIKQFWDKIR